MSLIEWDEKYSVGIAAVDHEHRELIGLVNEAHERLMRPGGEEAVMDFLGEI
ncbi:MAG: hemerythrin-like metal-binding protein, partial [Gammaproteobacteria bacterium]|nr:hemerythrin-like metal-binding protein [Gammaproteobacteria bacterium]